MQLSIWSPVNQAMDITSQPHGGARGGDGGDGGGDGGGEGGAGG